ncbi:MAG: NAD(P)-dependent oxidoreductase [Chloroflexi bacterium]|nr:NAD(P)-dependent oxidoreductase [Chloroflexota bacterium]
MADRVGFIGLGDIGLPMAKRVVSHGYEVTICGHVRRDPVEEMKRLGAREVLTPRDVAEVSDVVITVLRDDDDTGKVILDDGGVLDGARNGSGIVMMSTLSPAFCRKVAEAAKKKKMGVLDAPVTGTRMRAVTGELGIMVGGSRAVVKKYSLILETMGKVTYCGDLGMGEIVKLANNMAVMINVQGAFEAIAWGIKNGADEKLLVELMKTATGNSWVVQNWDYVKSMNVDPPPSTFYLGAKDLDYALRIAQQLKQPCPVAALCKEMYVAGVMKLPER